MDDHIYRRYVGRAEYATTFEEMNAISDEFQQHQPTASQLDKYKVTFCKNWSRVEQMEKERSNEKNKQ